MVAPRPSELALAVGILEGRFEAPRHLLQGPTRHAGSDEGEEDLVHTQAEIPASTIALESPQLAREESVLLRINELKKPEPKRPVTNFFAAVGTFVLETVLGPLRLYFTPARRVRRRASGAGSPVDLVSAIVQRIARLDGPTKVTFLAAPYVLALALAALLFERQHREANEPIALSPSAPAAVAATPPAPVPPAPPAEVAAAEPAPAEATAPAERHIVSLSWPATLRVKPSARAKRVATIQPGSQLEMLVDLHTEAGFVLAREVEGGAVGYMKVSELYEEPMQKRRERSSRSERRKRRYAGR